MFSALGRFKDAALEQALMAAARSRIERYGELKQLKVDTANKRVEAELQLLGEPEPVRVTEAFYRLEGGGDQAFAVFYGIKVSRRWAQNLLDDHFREIRVKVPSFAMNLLR